MKTLEITHCHIPVKEDGYIALVSLLIISAVILALGVSVNLRSLEELDMSFGKRQTTKASSLTQACTEEALERLRNDFIELNDSLEIDGNTCIMTVTINANEATVSAQGTVDNYTQTLITVVDNATGTLEIISRN